MCSNCIKAGESISADRMMKATKEDSVKENVVQNKNEKMKTISANRRASRVILPKDVFEGGFPKMESK